MNKQMTFKLAETLRMTAAVFLMLMLGAIYPTAMSDVNAQTQSKAGASSHGGPKEGLKIHGHWVIEVRDPDGRLVTRREFNNALTSHGAVVLAFLLSRQSNAGKWAIMLQGPSSFLGIQEPGQDFPIDGIRSKNLTVTRTPVSDRYTLVLSGSVVAPDPMNFNSVLTYQWLCDPGQTAAQCAANNPTGSVFDFTQHDLLEGSSTPPVALAAGQSVQVTVTLSFS